MKKILFLAFALVASVLVFVACDKKDKNDPEKAAASQIKGVKFISDIELGNMYVRDCLYFGLNDDFEYARETYEDQARTKLIDISGDYGTYVLNEKESYIDMTFLGAFYVVDGEREYHEGQQAHKDGRWTYKLEGDILTITAENGYSQTFKKQ